MVAMFMTSPLMLATSGVGAALGTLGGLALATILPGQCGSSELQKVPINYLGQHTIWSVMSQPFASMHWRLICLPFQNANPSLCLRKSTKVAGASTESWPCRPWAASSSPSTARPWPLASSMWDSPSFFSSASDQSWLFRWRLRILLFKQCDYGRNLRL